MRSIPNPALLVANGGDENIALIDPETLTVIGALAVAPGMHPHHIGLSPDRSRALISATSLDFSGGHGPEAHGSAHGSALATTTIYELAFEPLELREVLRVDATAHNAAFTSDGTLVVLSMAEHGMISGYDSTTFQTVFDAFGFEQPLEVTPTNAGAVLVAESGAGRVSLYDPPSRRTLRQFAVGGTPVAAWASGGNDYYVAAEEGRTLSHLQEVEESVASDGHHIELEATPGQAMLTPARSELWVALEDRSVVRILDAVSHEKLADVRAGDKPHGIAFAASGEHAFVTDEDGGKVVVIDVRARSVISELVLGGKPNGIAWIER